MVKEDKIGDFGIKNQKNDFNLPFYAKKKIFENERKREPSAGQKALIIKCLMNQYEYSGLGFSLALFGSIVYFVYIITIWTHSIFDLSIPSRIICTICRVK